MFNTRFFRTSDIQRYRIDRTRELAELKTLLLERGGNVLLHGARGVGKTFLLKMFLEDIAREKSSAFAFFFPVDINMVHTTRTHGDQSAFPLAFFYSLLASAWSQVANLPYVSLVTSHESGLKRLNFKTKNIELLARIYRQTHSSESEASYQKSAGLGAKAILEGNIDEEWKTKYALLPSHAIEVRHYIADLQKVIESETGCKRIIALCDEANLLPEEWQKKLIGGHIRELSDMGIQFVFAAGHFKRLEAVSIEDYFDGVIELRGIPEAFFRDYLASYYPEEVSHCSARAIKIIYDFSEGNPRLGMSIFLDASSLMHKNKRKTIRSEDAVAAVERARRSLAKFIKNYES